MVVEKHLWNIYTSYEQSYLLFRSPVKIWIVLGLFRYGTYMVHTRDGVVQQHLTLDLNWTFKTTLIEEHNVGLSALYSKFFEHVILYNETQIPKDFQDPLQLLSRSRNEWNLDEKYLDIIIIFLFGRFNNECCW